MLRVVVTSPRRIPSGPDLPVEVSKREATALRLAEIADPLPFAHAG